MWQTRLQLLLLALLISYLLIKQFQRVRQRWRAVRHEPKCPGVAINAAALQSRIQHLREDYTASGRKRSRRNFCREQLTAALRRNVRRCAYFRNRQAECSEDETHETWSSRE